MDSEGNGLHLETVRLANETRKTDKKGGYLVFVKIKTKLKRFFFSSTQTYKTTKYFQSFRKIIRVRYCSLVVIPLQVAFNGFYLRTTNDFSRRNH